MSEAIEALEPGEILDKLRNDADGSVCDAVVARIEQKTLELKRTLDRGVSPAEYEVLNKAQAALEQAPGVVKVACVAFRKLKQTEKQ